MPRVEGVVKSIIWSKPEDSFYIFTVGPRSRKRGQSPNDDQKVVGNTPFPIYIGMRVAVKGPIKDSKYGPQISLQAIEEIQPEGGAPLQKFLQNKIKGLGVVLSKRIVAVFGLDTMRVLSEDPDRLLEVEGISRKRLDEIVETWKSTEKDRGLMMFLFQLDLSPKLANRVKKHFRQEPEAEKALRENPYLLLDVEGIGITQADGAFLKLGGDPASSKRIFAFVKQALREASRSGGHIFLRNEEVYTWIERTVYRYKLRSIPGFSKGRLYAHLDNLDPDLGVERDADRLYLKWLLFAEKECAEQLAIRRFRTKLPEDLPLDRFISTYQEDHEIEFSTEQHQFLANFWDHSIHILTGLPGTGKTTVVQALVEMLELTGMSYALCAPTGMAAKRLEQLTGRKTFTMHRYLGATGTSWLRNSDNTCEEDVVIVDEFSMVDLALLFRLIDGTSTDTRFVFIGDTEQLPPVAAGNALKDLIASNLFDTVRLTRIYRQEEDSLIIENAHRISRDEPLAYDKKTFLQVPVRGPTFEKLLVRFLDKVNSTDRECMILSPIHRGPYGVTNINKLLQAHVNPPSPAKEEIDTLLYPLRDGDRVVICKNDYKRGVVNGDRGRIVSVDPKNRRVGVEVDEVGVVEYDSTDLSYLKLAYCLTVHKSQGSQAEWVAVVIQPEQRTMLSRKLFYTAVTRAKNMVVVIGDDESVRYSISNTREDKRNSFLTERLKEKVGYEGRSTRTHEVVGRQANLS